MRNFLVVFLVVLSFVAGQGEAAEPKKVRILFVGNSYTYFNNLPRLVEAIAEDRDPGIDVETEMVAAGGAMLRDLWNDGKAPGRIITADWDYVVLQEQSTLGTPKEPGEPGSKINDPAEFHAYAQKFDELIRKSGARTVFYMTWARKNFPQAQPELTRAYEGIAKERDAMVVPAGVLWQTAAAQAPQIDLYQGDRSHPSPAGSYFTAAVFYAALFCKSPEGAASRVLGTGTDFDGGTLKVSGSAPTVKSSSGVSILVDLKPEEVKRLQTIAAGTSCMRKH